MQFLAAGKSYKFFYGYECKDILTYVVLLFECICILGNMSTWVFRQKLDEKIGTTLKNER